MFCEPRKRKRSGSFDAYVPQVGIVMDDKVNKEFNKVPQLNWRGEMVDSLIEAYQLTGYCRKINVVPATETDLKNFHSSDFVEFMQSINTLYTPEDTVDLDFGLGYDCPPLDGIYDYIVLIGGSTLSASRSLMNGEVDIAINWNGGWHHAQRDQVSGFCYVNDIVLAILELKHCYERILYIDFDIHHGDGVEEAFRYSPNVMTLSFHKFEPGFFPGTGGLLPMSTSFVNIPLKSGITDDVYCRIFDNVLSEVLRYFDPKALVLQCGADGLSGDPLGGFSLSLKSYTHCLDTLIQLRLPTLMLGGGGYNKENTARLWTCLTALSVNASLAEDIPDHEFFTNYGPGYELSVTPSLRKNENDPDYIKQILSSVYNTFEDCDIK